MDILQSYCIKECVSWIQTNGFKKVALELPDPQHAPAVSNLLKKEIGFAPPVLLDSCNREISSCCVDERRSKVFGVEAIIHFGHACLTPSLSLPVLYVLNSRVAFDSTKLIELISSSPDRPKEDEDVILLYDILFTPFISSFYNILKTHFSNLILSKLAVPEKAKLTFYNDSKNLNFEELDINETNSKTVIINKRKFILPENKDIKDYNFIYVCSESESPAMFSYHMRFSDKVFYVVDHSKHSFTSSTFMKTVMGRSKKIEQVREAKSVGILLTLVHNHDKIQDRIERLIKFSKKKCFRYILGKINEAKLGNIRGRDIFVYIGCDESSLFDRHKQEYLYKNIVTPWEFEVALNPLYEWSLNFETNFNELLTRDIPEEPEEVKESNENVDKETNHIPKREKSNTEVMERRPGTIHKMHEGGAGEFLQSLSWKGLDPDVESSVPVGTIVEGRSGIPMMYNNEVKYKNING